MPGSQRDSAPCPTVYQSSTKESTGSCNRKAVPERSLVCGSPGPGPAGSPLNAAPTRVQWAWPSDPAVVGPTTPEPPGPRPKRHREPTPFAGLTHKPPCDACEHSGAPHPQPPAPPPPHIVPTRGRRRQVDTSTHFCPNTDCAYQGWVGRGNLRANGHPNGSPWRQLLCIACRRYFLESLGTIFHGKRASVDLIVRVIACLAEGLGIRGTARVFEVDPNTVLQWLVEAAVQLPAFSRLVLRDG